FFFSLSRPQPRSTLFPYTTLFRSEEIANPCPTGAPWKQTPGWTSWGGGLTNARFHSATEAGLSADALPRLALKWAFAFPDTSTLDRKSTRLNSSHDQISYAVFCLK